MEAKKTPEVSVIVPIYNVSRYVERCLRSLIEQDFDGSYEIIAVNDGSTDDSLSIVERIAAECDKIRVYSQKNGGLSAARNTGLSHARGKYVMFTDSDDFVDRRYISMMYSAAIRSGADIVCCNFRSVDENGAPRGIDGTAHHRAGVFSARDMLRSLLFDITIRSFAWNKLYRRSLFVKNGINYPEGKLFEDMYTTPRLFCRARRIAVISGVLYNYVHQSGSITGTMTPKKIFAYIDGYGGIRKILDEEDLYERYKLPFCFLGVKIGFTVIPMLCGCKRRDNTLKLGVCCKRAVRKLCGYAAPARARRPSCPNKAKNIKNSAV